jgi:hypothetical protein
MCHGILRLPRYVESVVATIRRKETCMQMLPGNRRFLLQDRGTGSRSMGVSLDTKPFRTRMRLESAFNRRFDS